MCNRHCALCALKSFSVFREGKVQIIHWQHAFFHAIIIREVVDAWVLHGPPVCPPGEMPVEVSGKYCFWGQIKMQLHASKEAQSPSITLLPSFLPFFSFWNIYWKNWPSLFLPGLAQPIYEENLESVRKVWEIADDVKNKLEDSSQIVMKAGRSSSENLDQNWQQFRAVLLEFVNVFNLLCFGALKVVQSSFVLFLLVIFNVSVAESQEQWFEPLLYGGMAESLKQSQNLSISSIRIEHD